MSELIVSPRYTARPNHTSTLTKGKYVNLMGAMVSCRREVWYVGFAGCVLVVGGWVAAVAVVRVAPEGRDERQRKGRIQQETPRKPPRKRPHFEKRYVSPSITRAKKGIRRNLPMEHRPITRRASKRGGVKYVRFHAFAAARRHGCCSSSGYEEGVRMKSAVPSHLKFHGPPAFQIVRVCLRLALVVFQVE